MHATLIDRRFWGEAVISAAGRMAKSHAAGAIATSVAGRTLVWVGEQPPTVSEPVATAKIVRARVITKSVPRVPKPTAAPQQWPVMPSRISPVTEILRKAERAVTRMHRARRGCDLTRLLNEMETAQRLRAQALMTKSQRPELWAFGSFGAFA